MTDSSYLDRLLRRVYFHYEAFGTRGYIAGKSERFLLSRSVERDHLAQKEALNALLEDLYDRGYVRLDDNENDWSDYVLRPEKRRQ